MALTFKAPHLPTGLVPGSQLIYAPALHAPRGVSFRPGADLKRVAADVLANNHVKLTAAVGAGKSSLMPHALAAVGGRLVVYTTANPLLALSAYTYAVKRSQDDASVSPVHRYSEGIFANMPRTGVLYCGAGEYVSLLLQAKEAGVALSGHVVFLDEAHKCDVWTYTISKLSLACGATHLVKVSATFDPDSKIMRETAGKVVEHEFDDVSALKWNTSKQGMPWSITRLTDGVVVFTDSRSEASHLVREYELSGFIVYRMVAGMDEGAYLKAMRDFNDKKGPMVALIADSSFRDGFSFGCSTAIDTGRVGYYMYEPGGVVRVYRDLYKVERLQTSGRFARMGAVTAHYYCPRVPNPERVCDLAPVEMEAAAYVFRLLGFSPTGELRDAVMASSVLPAEYEFATVINAMYPLQHYVLDASGRPRTPPPGYTTAQGSTATSTVSVPWFPEGGNARSSSSSSSSGTSESSDDTGASSADEAGEELCDEQGEPGGKDFKDCFNRLREDKPAVVQVSEGDYCHIASISKREVNPVHFPRGIESLDHYFPPGSTEQELGKIAARHDPVMLDDALSLVLVRYNTLNAYARGMRNTLERVQVEGMGKNATPRFWQEIERMAEQFTDVKSETNVMLTRLKVLANGRHRVQLLSGDVQAERMFAKDLYDKLSTMVHRRVLEESETLQAMMESLYDGDRTTIAIKRDRSIRVERGEAWAKEAFAMPGWCGFKEVEHSYDREGKVVKTRLHTNKFGRKVLRMKDVDVDEIGNGSPIRDAISIISPLKRSHR